MSGTMTVKELIKELLEYGMDEPVYIGLGPKSIPDGRAQILQVNEFSSGIVNPLTIGLAWSDHNQPLMLACLLIVFIGSCWLL